MKRATILCAGLLISVGACRWFSSPASEGLLQQRGVSLQLARQRAASISDIHYGLELELVDDPDQPIAGRLRLRFNLESAADGVLLDFVDAATRLDRVLSGQQRVDVRVGPEHILLPVEALTAGTNEFLLEFTAADTSLNRRRDYLYALFVPDRAREAFPCFDQPDLKARFQLTLEMPAAWRALTNGRSQRRTELGERTRVSFSETPPISTYLFTFVAGEFQEESGEFGGRRLRFLHRETDSSKVARNRDAIFELHSVALDWLENYTAIDYPFEKFEFALLPAFQFGGMEHPGAVFYRDTSLLLGTSPTQNEKLARASLIAHETAHMWFGDLVTMRWFDDVWTKEVFANFMAAKIVEPSFPEVDHRLRFLLSHHPAAYAVDRSAGTHPVRQPLENLDDAASLYGALIYQKAPIIMKQLEGLVGPEEFREGLHHYLTRFSFGNASWPELIEILDARSSLDLRSWSRRWVEEAGRPRVSVAVQEQGGRWMVSLVQTDPQGLDRHWVQQLETMAVLAHNRLLPVRVDAERVEVAQLASRPQVVLPDVSGTGYAEFELDPASRAGLLSLLAGPVLPPVARASGWLAVWEDVLHGRLAATEVVGALTAALRGESDPLLIQHLLGRLETLYWRFLTEDQRRAIAVELEELLWGRTTQEAGSATQKSFFRSWSRIALTSGATEQLAQIAREELPVEGLQLDRSDFTALVVALAIRQHPGWPDIVALELERIENPERRRRLEFIRGALSGDPRERREWFETLREPGQRRREPWVLAGLNALHHPLRAAESVELIDPALEMLLEVKASGDIFFPKRWTDAVLGGHSSPEAAAVVQAFLDRHPDYPARLKGKVLQSADLLLRAARLHSK